MAKKKSDNSIKVMSLKEIQKRFPGTIQPSLRDDSKLPKIPTRFLAYNYQIGGGIPYGKQVEFVGEESSGKTLMAYDVAYCAQQLGGVVIWSDPEQSFTNDWALKNGLDLDRLVLNRATQIETIADWFPAMAIYWRSKLTHNEPIVLILDSLAAVDSKAVINSQMEDEKAEMAARARAIGKMLRIRQELYYTLGVCVIYMNQLRKKLGASPFENPDTTPGGNAMKFTASIRSGFYGGREIVDKKKRKLGRLTTIRVIKNKVAPPKATISKAPMFYNPKYHEIGFDRYFGLADVLEEEGIVVKSSGGVYKYKGNVLCRGEEKFIKLLEQDDELRRKLIRKAGINTINTTQKQLDKIKYNMFPVNETNSKFDSYEESEDTEEEE